MNNLSESILASCLTQLLASNGSQMNHQNQNPMNYLQQFPFANMGTLSNIPEQQYNLNLFNQSIQQQKLLPLVVNPLPRRNHHQRNKENTTEKIILQLEKAATDQKNTMQDVLDQIHYQHDCLVDIFDEMLREKDELSFKVAELERIVSDRLKSRQNSPKEDDTVSQKKSRRRAEDIKKEFTCPYENCGKTYGTEVSLNLHMKLKHNGGSKTERETQAKKILEARLANQEPPQIDINFPPGFLATVAESLGKDQSYQFRKLSEASYISTEEQSL